MELTGSQVLPPRLGYPGLGHSQPLRGTGRFPQASLGPSLSLGSGAHLESSRSLSRSHCWLSLSITSHRACKCIFQRCQASLSCYLCSLAAPSRQACASEPVRQQSVNKQTGPPLKQGLTCNTAAGSMQQAGLHMHSRTQGREGPEPPARCRGPGKHGNALVWIQ